MYFDYQSQEIHQMSSKTKCQRFKYCFSEVDDWSPIIAKPIVSRPIIAIFSATAICLLPGCCGGAALCCVV